MTPAKQTARQARASKIRRQKQEAPSTLTVPALIAIWCVGAIGCSMGLAVVQKRFEAQDHRMETGRLQEIMQVRRDEIRMLEYNVAGLTRGASLRETAITQLSMVEPTAEVVDDLVVSESDIRFYQKATEEAREAIEAKQVELVNFSEEVF